jgi:hypothetical protein
MTYKEILSEETNKEIDTDYGILRAYWSTCKRLIEQRDKIECQNFLRHVVIQWGQFKAVEMRGDMIDAGIINN